MNNKDQNQNFLKAYNMLNDAQRKAVDNFDGPMLVLAGPGTGKTQLLSARVANILYKTDTPASSILCLTFTETGAANMRDRLTSFIGQDANNVEINTYHGFSQTIINQNNEYFIDKNLKNVVDSITQFQIVSEMLNELPKNHVLKNVTPRDIIASFGEVKQANLVADDLRKISHENKSQIDEFNTYLLDIFSSFKAMPRKYEVAAEIFAQTYNVLNKIALKISILKDFKPLLQIAKHELADALIQAEEINSTRPLTAWKDNWLEKNKDGQFVFKDNFNQIRLETLADLYDRYSKKIKSMGLYDFNDMIIEAIKAIEENSDLKFNLQEKYLYILLDEYQDTNIAQSKLIELLTDNPVYEGRPNIMAVGDDDQAIYAFQGADYSNMLNFYKRYRNTELVNLTYNYRSSAEIIQLSKNIANQIDDSLVNLIDKPGITKELLPGRQDLNDTKIERIDFVNSLSQNEWVANKILELKNSGEKLSDIAILAPKHKFLESIAPYISNKGVALKYEKSENVLENPGIKIIISIAKLVTTISNLQFSNSLLFEVLSSEIWGIPTPTLWQLVWKTKSEKSENWLDFINKSNEFSDVKKVVDWILAYAKNTKNYSLEKNFDVLIGNIEIEGLKSPLKEFYLKQSDKKLLDFILDLNILRDKYIEYAKNHSNDLPALEVLIKMVDDYNLAEEKILRQNSYTENENAVNLMTVFSSKGLEFKHVFLLESNDNTWGKARSNSNRVSLPANLAPIRHDTENINEKIRLLFVAVSRAKTHLYILNPLQNLTSKPNKRLSFYNEIEQDKDWYAKMLPERFQKILKIESDPTYSELENNLVHDFSDWQSRHINDLPKFKELLIPKLERFRLSPTALNKYTDLCYGGPNDYFLEIILGFPSEFSLKAAYGSLVHFTIDKIEKNKITPTAENILEIFRSKLNDLYLIDSDKQTLNQWGSNALPLFVNQRSELFNQKDIKIVSEVKVSLNGDIRLTGNIDRLEIDTKNKEITVVDFKTGKSHSKIDNSDISLYGYIKQLYFYKHLLQNSPEYAGYKINKWRLEFIEPDKYNQINYIEGEFDNERLEEIKKLISVIWQKTMNLDFSEPQISTSPTLKDIKAFEQELIS